MDRIVNLMEGQAAREINRLRACALAIAGLVLILLIGLGWFVVRPSTRAIRTQVDNLESRFAQRRSDLADALASLRHQIAEREAAEVKNKALSAQLIHADRVASMGHLTIGLAHELNQPLAAIANYSEACHVLLSKPRESREPSQFQDNIIHIKRAALRAAQIVRRIRNFVRGSPSTIADADINDLVQEAVAVCRQEIVNAKVELTLDLSADDGLVSVDPIQIQQVLVNLVQNALQAMQNCLARDRRLSIRTSRGFDTVRVDLFDSGPGFDAADADAIFEPFHTTKDEGLGFGLAICRSIIGNHDGTIWANSVSGNGAQFSFELPLTRPHDFLRPVGSYCVCG
jgi:C4-dicarboxylate-specific signal transduction histidine kinase